MGYTIGRRLTKDSIINEAKKYQTKSEFMKKDSSCYQTARRSGILEEVCLHMKKVNFSIPQKICEQIFNHLFNCKAIYNTRQIIKPYELDLYYPELSFAIEYHGKGWHSSQEVKQRDKKKETLCQEKNINLFTIIENNRNYEEDIKNQIIENLQYINKCTKLNISSDQITSINIDYTFQEEIHKSFLNEKEIKEKIKDCKNIAEFQKKYPTLYERIRKAKLLNLLLPIKTRHSLSTEELILECKKIKHYKDLVRNTGLYLQCYKKGVLELVSKHMIQSKNKSRNLTEDKIKIIAKKYKRRCDFQDNDCAAYKKAWKFGLIEELFPNKYQGRGRKLTLTLEKIHQLAKECNDRSDFRNKYNSAYRKAIKFVIIDSLFPKKGV